MNRKERRAKAKQAGSGKGAAAGRSDVPALLSAAVQAHRAGRLGETIQLCRRVLAGDPAQPDALQLLAVVALAGKKGEEALKLLLKAVKAAPERADIQNNLGNAWLAVGNPEKAIAAFERAVLLMPEYAEAHYNLGEALRRTGRLKDAEQALRRTLDLQPDNAGNANKLGSLLIDLGRWKEAEEFFRQAIELQPDLASGWLNLGAVLDHFRRTEEALAVFEKVLALSPGNPRALARLIRPYQLMCAWDKLARTERLLDQATDRVLAAGGTPVEDPFANLSRRCDPRRNLRIADAWSKTLERTAEGARFADRRTPARDGKLTVGYLSSDFNDHPVGQLVGGLFALHDRSAFDVVALSTGPGDGSLPRRRAEEDCDRFVDLLGSTYRDAARRIHEENLDILVDLNGFSLGTGLGICASRPAPVQMTWLGYPGTTGARFIDYLIADPIVVPPASESFFSEAILRLPESFLPAANLEQPARTGLTRAEAGLPEKAIVFCSFNQAYKIEPELFDAWMEILAGVPDSVLWLARVAEEAGEVLRARLRDRGLAPERLIIADRVAERARHLERISLADVGLDTWTYGGHSTTVDALWAGVPVVTRLGSHFPARVCASVLRAANLPELVADSQESYVAKAITLALDPAGLGRIRTHLTEKRWCLPLFDGQRFVGFLEEAYRMVWARHQRGQRPASLDLSPS